MLHRSDHKSDPPEPTNIVSKISGLFGLYTVFVFLSGWTFLDYYYRSFGLSTRSLDLPLSEILMKGFTVLFEGAWALWFIYLFIVIVPVLVEMLPKLRNNMIMQLILSVTMLSCVPAVYYIAKAAGKSLATKNKGNDSELPVITFRVGCKRFLGNLLYFHNGTYFVHDVKFASVALGSETNCHGDVNADTKIQRLTIYRSDQMEDLTIVE